MSDIREQKLIYHLTSVANIGGILDHGLLPRSQLRNFQDVADQGIIEGRREHGLENYVPFHWFSRNPFDGRVQADRPEEEFALIAIRRSLAQRENWSVIPRHPLANAAPELMGFEQGVVAINWEVMNTRDYHDLECKSICMAECLAPGPVPVNQFFKIYAPNQDVANEIRGLIGSRGLGLEVVVNENMFL